MLEIKSLTKEYNGCPALSDLNWTIRENGVYGFLGPNGAGKSTTMNIITGCLSATSGEVYINGCSILENALNAKRQIGFLPEIPPLYADMTPYEYLRFVAGFKGIPKGSIDDDVRRVMELCSIVNVRNKLIRFLSKGYCQRVGIAQAILGSPSLIVLDEPTAGLDPAQIAEARELIRNLGRDHVVLFSSHILSEVQAISKRVLIIQKGRTVAEGTPEELKKFLGANRSQVSFTVKTTMKNVESLLAGKGYVISEKDPSESNRCTFTIDTDSAEKTAEEMFFIFAHAELPVIRIEYAKTDLENIFLELTSTEKGSA